MHFSESLEILGLNLSEPPNVKLFPNPLGIVEINYENDDQRSNEEPMISINIPPEKYIF